jgi:DNA-binding CsgD family transcriptional regulator
MKHADRGGRGARRVGQAESRSGGTAPQLRKTGLGVLRDMPWGTHCCHFYQTQKDLRETLIPYFRAGLEGKEFCLWIVDQPLTEFQARRLLRRAIPHCDQYLADGSMEIVSAQRWHFDRGAFSPKRALRRWNQKLEQASARGYAGMRVAGNPAWLRRKDWKRFGAYERALTKSFARKAVIILCSYFVPTWGAADVFDVARTHGFAIARRHGKWEILERRTPSASSGRYETLTTREREVLVLAADGFSNPEIAHRLSISARTAESHRANLMRKLGLRNQTGLVRYALGRGLVAAETGDSGDGRAPEIQTIADRLR